MGLFHTYFRQARRVAEADSSIFWYCLLNVSNALITNGT
jgi:hypothetical protein